MTGCEMIKDIEGLKNH